MSSVESHPPSSNVRPGHRDPHAHAADQPFEYPQKREFFEPDWTRLPGYRDVTKDQWESAQWQRAHTVKNLKEFAEALGDHLDPELLEDIRVRGATLLGVADAADEREPDEAGEPEPVDEIERAGVD